MPYAVDRENVTTPEMFDAMASVLFRLERIEEVMAVLGGMVLTHLNQLRATEDYDEATACAEIADYMLLIRDMRAEALREAAFLDARE